MPRRANRSKRLRSSTVSVMGGNRLNIVIAFSESNITGLRSAHAAMQTMMRKM